MKKYLLFSGWLVWLLLLDAACAPKLDTAGRRLGDSTGRVYGGSLSCVGYCSRYAASGNE